MPAIDSLVYALQTRGSAPEAPILEAKADDGFKQLLGIAHAAQVKNQIPRIIHKIWWQGMSNLPEKYHLPLHSWQVMHSEWNIVIWDQESVFQMMQQFFPHYEKMLGGYPLMIQKIDAAKYFLLKIFGGCYSDMDQFCIHPVDSIVEPETEENDLVVSLLTESPGIMFLTSAGQYRKGPYCNNAFILSKPQASIWEFIHKCVESRQARARSRKVYSALPRTTHEIMVLNTTGPVAFTQGIRGYFRTRRGTKAGNKA